MARRRAVGSRRGFTLLEVLVVIGIVAALAALLLPVLGRAREQARRVKCAANLRTIGQALTMYTQVYARYPACSAEAADEPTNNPVAIWPTRLRAFTGGNHDVFYCPSQDPRCAWPTGGAGPRADARFAPFGYEPGEPLLFSRSGTYFSYGYNHMGIGDVTGGRGLGGVVAYRPDGGRELHASRVKVPAAMIAIADTKADGFDDFMVRGFAADVAEPGKVHPAAVHGGGTNVLFCDGHVQWYRQDELTVSKVPGQFSRVAQMWNNSNTPY